MIQSKLQDRMQRLLESVVADGSERGVQLAVYRDGVLVVDACAGVADVESNTLVKGDTLFPVYSVTKGVTSTVIHLLAQRGQIQYDTPIANYWPEFAAHGKSNITVRHALSHTAGLPFMPMGLKLQDLGDWTAMCTAIANLTPVYPPGERTIYHAITFGWLLGELARRVDGRPISKIVQEDICRPLGMSDIFIGIPDDVEPRIATLHEIFEPGKEPTPEIETTPSSVPSWMKPSHELMNRPDARRACLPGSGGIMSARAIARFYAALVPGGVDGIELLSPEKVREATVWQKASNPQEGDSSTRFGLGYQLLPSPTDPQSWPMFGHNGYGGSFGFADPSARLAVGFTKNLFSPRGAQNQIVTELRSALRLE
jgi:CubicO group peptidase (beta-lactamase class C family)